MKAIIKKSAVIAMAIGIAIPVSTPAFSQSRDAIAGGIVGGIIGGAIGSAARRRHREPDVVYVEPRPVYREPVYVERRVITRPAYSGNAHVNWCYRKYRSYQESSNTYVTYGGRVRQCYSPYN
jgi:hypothetical protein